MGEHDLWPLGKVVGIVGVACHMLRETSLSYKETEQESTVCAFCLGRTEKGWGYIHANVLAPFLERVTCSGGDRKYDGPLGWKNSMNGERSSDSEVISGEIL